MTNRETITISRAEYDALVAQNAELEDYVAALKADDGSRIPHPVALAIIRGDRPLSAFRSYRGLTLRQLAEATGLAPGYISEIERGVKPGSVSALSRLAAALDTRIDVLAMDAAEQPRAHQTAGGYSASVSSRPTNLRTLRRSAAN